MIAITEEYYYQKILSIGEIAENHQIIIPDNDEVSGIN